MYALQKKFMRSLRDPEDSTKTVDPWFDNDNRTIPDFLEESALPRTSRYRGLKKKYGESTDSIDFYLNKPIPMTVFAWGGEIDTLMSPMDSLRYYKNFLQSGFMAVDPHNGEIKAWVGGINYKYFKYDHVRLGKRQPGSLFKPIVYTAAVERGYSPCHTFADQAVSIPQPNGEPWSPQNSDGKFTGEMVTMEFALANSMNSVSAQIVDIVKPANAAKMADRLGLQTKINPYHSMVLGTQEVALQEIVSAYGTFVNEGVHIEPHYVTRIEDRFGNVIYTKVPQKKTAINKDVAYVMLDMLMGAANPARPKGFGGRLKYTYGLMLDPKDSMEMGGKTGTTQNGSDGWFMGVTKDLVAGAWVGGDDRAVRFKAWTEGQGSRTALPIVGGFFQRVYEDSLLNLTRGPFIKPENLQMEIDCQEFLNLMNPQDTVATDSIFNEEIY
jgi:penicillin-binding protein 1A